METIVCTLVRGTRWWLPAARRVRAPSQTENNSLLALINIENGGARTFATSPPSPRLNPSAPTPPDTFLIVPFPSFSFRSLRFSNRYFFAALLPRFALSYSSLVPLLFSCFFFYQHRRVIGSEPTSHPFAFLSATFFWERRTTN